jgi:hypothetical protein
MVILVRALRAKYVEIRRLRTESDPSPQLAMRELAADFPGALRELDELPIQLIEERIVALEAALAGGPLPDWARWAIAYHGLLRVVLRIRRRAGKDKDLAALTEWLAHRYLPTADEPSLEELSAEVVAEILRPPDGRLNRWVFAYLAPSFGQTADELEKVIFPPSPMRQG